MYEIEKGIPAPKITPGRHRIYPFSDMEVGDSFLVPVESKKDKLAKSRSILGSCRGDRFKGKKFSTKQVDGGVRVWMVA